MHKTHARRWAGWAMMTGGALLALNYLLWIGNGIDPSRVPVDPDGPLQILAMATVAVGTALLALGLAVLLAEQTDGSSIIIFGGGLLVAAFGLWALGAVTSFLPVLLPRWLVLISPMLALMGSGLYGVGGLRAGTLPRWPALVVGILGPLGLAIFAVPDLLWGLAAVEATPAVQIRVVAYVALLLFGLAWAEIGRVVGARAGWMAHGTVEGRVHRSGAAWGAISEGPTGEGGS